jgi:hypothetical protein
LCTISSTLGSYIDFDSVAAELVAVWARAACGAGVSFDASLIRASKASIPAAYTSD